MRCIADSLQMGCCPRGGSSDITSEDVWAAHQATLQAAEVMGDVAAVEARMRQVVAAGGPANFVAKVLGRVLAS